MRIKQAIYIVVLLIISTLSSVTLAKITHIAVGHQYNDRNTNDYFILLSDQFNKWTFTKAVDNAPTLMKYISFHDINCQQNQCVAVGSYPVPYGNERQPLLMSSQDSGLSWVVPKHIAGINTQFHYLEGYLSQVICEGKVCLSSGTMLDKYSIEPKRIALLSSVDGGISWSLPQVTGNAVSDISRLACLKNNCIAIGNKSILTSPDKGLNWKSRVDKLKNHGPIVASNHYFLAGGAQHTEYKPQLSYSKDFGESFIINQNISYPSDLISGKIDTMSCQGDLCVIGGHYYSDTHQQKLLLYVSHDGGESWSTPNDAVQLPKDLIGFILDFSGCTKDACLIAGSYHTGRYNMPLVFSIDSKHMAKRIAFKSDFNLIDITCSPSSCTLVATTGNYRFDKTTPQLLQSDHDLISWENISDPTYKQAWLVVKPHKLTALAN